MGLDGARYQDAAFLVGALLREGADDLILDAVGADVELLSHIDLGDAALSPLATMLSLATPQPLPHMAGNSSDEHRMLVASMVRAGTIGDLHPDQGGAAPAA